MVVAPQPLAVEEGVKTLRRGGNAFDAAVTAAFVQMVVDPQMCGVAGFGVANLRAADGRHEIIDFNGTAGSRATPDMWQDIVIEQDWTGYGYHVTGAVNDVGYGSIMTPGTIAGMAATLRRFGTISWAEALAPAIRIAEEGFPVSPELWQLWNVPSADQRFPMRQRLATTEASRRLFLRDTGETLRPGEILRQPDYAAVLRRLAEAGPEDFYTGEIAARMVEDFERNGAFITADDLANYQVRIESPLTTRYRGYTIHTNPPAGGGICLAQILNILNERDIASLGLNSVDYIDLVARAMQAGFHDWYTYVGDPRFADVPVAWLLSEERTREWITRIDQREPIRVPLYPEPPSTTHITVVDEAGNCAAITHSLGSSSGVVTPGLGFTYNNIMNAANPIPGHPNSIAPGKARLTGMCPTIVTRGDEPVLVLGAPGGTRIITGVLHVILNVLDHGLSPVEAVVAPRFDAQSHRLDCEARIPSWVKEELGRRGFTIVPDSASYWSFPRVQVITRDPVSGELRGGADPRGGGAVMTA
ncbi:MAG: gamma-glutamyltransferase [Sphaerobacter sp.]|nr:gamma-glutamyltransferase [Sphaerobacter sp.]